MRSEIFIPNVNENFVPCEDKTVYCISCGRLGGCECGKYDYRSVYDWIPIKYVSIGQMKVAVT